MADWDTDRNIVLAGNELLNVCVLQALTIGLDPICAPWLESVRRLADEFGQEPDQMGSGVASIWQDRAYELSEAAINDVNFTSKLVCYAALQLVAIVNALAREHGGLRTRRFGFAILRVVTEVSDRGARLAAHPEHTTELDPRDMLDFIAARARDLRVPQEVIISKLARRGL